MNRLSICISPRWENDTVADMALRFEMAAENISAEGPVLTFPEQGFGGLCPFPEYEDLVLEDEAGEIPFHIREVPSWYSAITYRGIFAEREIRGALRWSYRLFPRILPEGYRSSPYYDFRNEPYGLNGSGFFAFILPGAQAAFETKLHWDMSAMPEGARAVWTYGEGDVERVMTPYQIGFSLFQVGVMHAVENGDFGVYWFMEPEFDAASVARRLLPIFSYMKQYFQDEKAGFKVFLRRDPFEVSGGGSACPYTFISGYSAFGGMNPDKWFNTLIHEMTHTWPCMDDMQVGTGTWFTEGCTEYYCTLLPYRGGFLDAEYTAARINEKITGRYYHNVYRETSNMEIARIQWQDRRGQVVPYGRGFLYLANVEAKLRKANRGSIDEIVLQHNWMTAGKLLIPEENLFGPEFETVEETCDLEGKEVISYHWKARKE